MTSRRRYSRKIRDETVGIAMVEGVTEASRQTGIPKVTIWQWERRPEYEQLRTTAREAVVDQFWVGIQIGLREVVKGIEGDAPLKEKADALRVMADRYALLTGSATVRTESRDITGSISDAELLASLAEANALTAPGGSPEKAEDSPEG